MRRIALAFTTLAWLVAAHAAASDPPSTPTTPLNVLLITVDDLNTRLGCYGSDAVATPNIDELASRGTLFEHAYCQFPLCNPSRTSFLSGLRPETTQILDSETPPRTHIKDVRLLPEYFHDHGYFTARISKIAHAKFEDSVSWDVAEKPKGQPKGSIPQRNRNHPKPKSKLQWEATDHEDAQEVDGFSVRRAAEWIRADRDQPFFIGVGFRRPHLPFVAPKPYFDRYPLANVALPNSPADDRADVPSAAFPPYSGDQELTPPEQREIIRAYQACISFVDAQIGVLLKAVDEAGVADRTIIVFVSDHGYHLGEHQGMWRKMSLFEESAHVPLIIVAPGKRPAVSTRLVELVDLYPTLVELAGLPPLPYLQGKSLTPLLDDPNQPWKQAAFTTVKREDTGIIGRSVRTERFRYTEWGNPSAAELYDHHADPHEFVNLARRPEYAATVADLSRQLADAAKPIELPH